MDSSALPAGGAGTLQFQKARGLIGNTSHSSWITSIVLSEAAELACENAFSGHTGRRGFSWRTLLEARMKMLGACSSLNIGVRGQQNIGSWLSICFRKWDSAV